MALSPQDSDSDSESEIELRSTQTSPETTTSDESDGTLVDTSTSTTPTPPLLREGDLDFTEGHSQLSVGTLPLTDKDPTEKKFKRKTCLSVITREMVIVLLEIEDKAKVISKVLCVVKVEEEVDLTNVQMSDILE